MVRATPQNASEYPGGGSSQIHMGPKFCRWNQESNVFKEFAAYLRTTENWNHDSTSQHGHQAICPGTVGMLFRFAKDGHCGQQEVSRGAKQAESLIGNELLYAYIYIL